MKVWLSIFIALVLSVLSTDIHAQGCSKRSLTRIKLTVSSKIKENKIVAITSSNKKCTKRFRILKNQKSKLITLSRGVYNLTVQSPSCNTTKKRFSTAKSKNLKISVSCPNSNQNKPVAISAEYYLIPKASIKIPLKFQTINNKPVTFSITEQPKYGTIKAITDSGEVIFNPNLPITEDNFSFKVIQAGTASLSAKVTLRIPTTSEQILNSVVTLGIASNEQLFEIIHNKSFNQIFNQLDTQSLNNLLHYLHVISGSTDINNILASKNTPSAVLSLKPAGILTSATSLIGGTAIQYKGPEKPLQNLLIAPTTYSRLRDLYSSNPTVFLNLTTPSVLNSILFANPSSDVTASPILLITNETVPFHLGGASEQINRRIPITLKFEDGQKIDSWSIPTLTSVIKSIPADQRTFFVTFGGGSAVETMDPLKDELGNVIEKFPGVPHRFPSYQQWAERVRQNLRNYLTDIKSSFEASNGTGSITRYVAIDFESIRIDWESTVLYFEGQHALLLRDPKIIALKQALNLSDTDILSLSEWQPTDPRRLKWDAYVLANRAKIIEYAIGSVFREVFGNSDIITSNYDDAFRSDIVPNGAFDKKEFRTWGSIGTFLNATGKSLSSVPIYGLHYHRVSTPEGQILSTPAAPEVIHQVTNSEYYTRSNTFVSTLNRLQSITSASSQRTNHYVTFKEFIDVWHNGYYGNCMRFNDSTKRYERQVCNDTEGMGKFMYEYWALAAQNAQFINLYTLSTNLLPISKENALEAQHYMKQINRLLGYSDRAPAYDASVIIDGVKKDVTATLAEYNQPFYVWASIANNKRVYRVVFMGDNNFDKSATIINDGKIGNGVVISYQGKQLEIPGGLIDHESASDPLTPFGFYVTQPLETGKL